MGILRIQTRLAMEWEFIVALVIAIPIKLAREGKGWSERRFSLSIMIPIW